jgi:hypothetical protein
MMVLHTPHVRPLRRLGAGTLAAVPTRADVETNTPGVLRAFENRSVIPVLLAGEDEKKADGLFKELVVGRPR